MHLDVQELRNFYYRTSLGRAAQRVIRDQLQLWWPPEAARGQTVVGYGFAVPLLRPYLATARRVIGLMPGPQGVMPWPAGEPNVSVLCDEALWPLETGSVDRLVVLHGLETAEHPPPVLAEARRVLGPGGRLIVVAPNRAGLWARRDATPFGYGQPYTAGQLEALLRRHAFFPERALSLLYQPPSQHRFWLKSGPFWERLGRSLPMILAGGAVMTEASKQVQTPIRPGLGAAVRRPLELLEGIGKPEAEPV